VNLVRLMQVPDLVDIPGLKFAAFVPASRSSWKRVPTCFGVIRKGDVLLHHPFQSFDPVIDFLEQSVDDPTVVAIKQTVYRTGTDSVLMKYLIDAAQRARKSLSSLSSSRARRGSEPELGGEARKKSARTCLRRGRIQDTRQDVARGAPRGRQAAALRACFHGQLSSAHREALHGFRIADADEKSAEDVNEVFQAAHRTRRARRLHHLWISPFSLHERVLAAIKREANHARAGRPGHIIAKMNALIEPKVIEDALPGFAGRGENRPDRARGMLPASRNRGPFREYTRALCHRTVSRTLAHLLFPQRRRRKSLSVQRRLDGRNFFGRIELCFPVLDRKVKERVIQEGLKPYLSDNSQAWRWIRTATTQRKKSRGRIPRSAQEQLLALLAADK